MELSLSLINKVDMKFVTQLLLFFSLISPLSISFAQTELSGPIPVTLEQGIELYEKEQYKDAVVIFQQLVIQEPENSNYYHWLGKNYGRIAENAPWLTAMSMAKKTREAFEKAVEIDSTNIDAMIDLKQYYLDAPGFLGGSKKKASEIAVKIEKIIQNTEQSTQ